MHVVVSGTGYRPVVVKAVLTVHLAHTVAEAFTGEFDEGRALHHALREAFLGFGPFDHYCVDMTLSDMFYLTFGNAPGPILDYRGVAARLSNPVAGLYLHTAEPVRPGRISPAKPRPHFIGGTEENPNERA